MRMKIIPRDDVANPFMTSQTTLLNDLAFSATKNCLAVSELVYECPPAIEDDFFIDHAVVGSVYSLRGLI